MAFLDCVRVPDQRHLVIALLELGLRQTLDHRSVPYAEPLVDSTLLHQVEQVVSVLVVEACIFEQGFIGLLLSHDVPLWLHLLLDVLDLGAERNCLLALQLLGVFDRELFLQVVELDGLGRDASKPGLATDKLREEHVFFFLLCFDLSQRDLR